MNKLWLTTYIQKYLHNQCLKMEKNERFYVIFVSHEVEFQWNTGTHIDSASRRKQISVLDVSMNYILILLLNKLLCRFSHAPQASTHNVTTNSHIHFNLTIQLFSKYFISFSFSPSNAFLQNIKKRKEKKIYEKMKLDPWNMNFGIFPFASSMKE